MNVVYNSEHFSVLSYPAEEGCELVDKESARLVFLQGPYYHRFWFALSQIPEDERCEDTIDAFLEDYCDDNASPIVFH
jgi:hypothetical protein